MVQRLDYGGGMTAAAGRQPEPPAAVAGLPSWLLNELALVATAVVGEALAEFGLRKHHFAVLTLLVEAGPLSQADIGRRLGIDRSDLHAVLNELAGAGYAVRRADDRDRRRNSVEFTAGGRQALLKAGRAVGRAQDRLLEPLSPGERAQFTASLSTLARAHRADGPA